MCGRFVVSYSYDELVKMLEEDFVIEDIKSTTSYPSYNVAPGTNVLAIIKDKNTFRAGEIKWGFHTTNNFLVNIRSESIDILFNKQLTNNRCLIVASGYYEWTKEKEPYYFFRDDIMYFAAVYQIKDKKSEVSIITKTANDDIYNIHSRMPVILTKDEAQAYLETNDMLMVKKLLNTEISVKNHPVRNIVNKVHNNSVNNIEPFYKNKLF